jgi:PIN domain nuclease of toxin-antitoxin system
VRLLLDTHVLIWLVEVPTQIPARVSELIIDDENAIFVSAVTAWEIATKAKLGKLNFDRTFVDDFDGRVKALGFEPLHVSSKHAVTGARLASNHKDPFDRLLAGQAIIEGLTLVTRDAMMRTLGVTTIW